MKPERTRIYACAYMSTQKAAKGNYSLLASGSLPLVVVIRDRAGQSHQRPTPALLRAATGTATSGAARTVVYILFPILPPGASKPRSDHGGALRDSVVPRARSRLAGRCCQE